MTRGSTVTFYVTLFVFSLLDGIIARNLPTPTPTSTLRGTTTIRPVAGPMVLLPTTATTIQNVITSSPQYTSPTHSSLAESTDLTLTIVEMRTYESAATNDALPPLPSEEQVISASSESQTDILERSSTPLTSADQRTSTSSKNKLTFSSWSLTTSKESTSVLSTTQNRVSPSSGESSASVSGEFATSGESLSATKASYESLSPSGTVQLTPSSGVEFIPTEYTSLSPLIPVTPSLSHLSSLLPISGSSFPMPVSSSSRSRDLGTLVLTQSSSFVTTPDLQTLLSSRPQQIFPQGTPETKIASPSVETRASIPNDTADRSTTSTLSLGETDSDGSKTQILPQGQSVNAISRSASSGPPSASTFQTTLNSLTECEGENCKTTGQALEAEQWKTIAAVGLSTAGSFLILLVVGSVIFFKSYFKSRIRKMSPRVVPEGSVDQPEHFEVEGEALKAFNTRHVDT